MLPPLIFRIYKLQKSFKKSHNFIKPFSSSNKFNDFNDNNSSYSYNDRDRRKMYNNNNNNLGQHRNNLKNPNPGNNYQKHEFFLSENETKSPSRSTKNPNFRIENDFFPSDNETRNFSRNNEKREFFDNETRNFSRSSKNLNPRIENENFQSENETRKPSRSTKNPKFGIENDFFPSENDTKSPSRGTENDNTLRNKSQSQRMKDGNDFLEKFKLGFGKGNDKKEPDTKEKVVVEEEIKPPEGADEIFKRMKETGLIPNAVAMLDGLCKDGLVQEAMKLFSLMREKEVEHRKEIVVEEKIKPEGADEIFKKMKETGLIPNAVAMLDELCKDGLVQEAMKLFGLIREKGTIPEVVIYTAVVDGFCKAQKLDDAVRIFRKMQSNGIVPNAFSYKVLVQGLCKGKRFEDALEICFEMLEAGHSPNLVTFVGMVDGFCQEKGVEEGRAVITTLREKGYVCDEKGVRQYLDKKGPSLPLVWEALFGKSNLQ